MNLERVSGLLCLPLLFCSCALAEDDPGQSPPAKSPNGRFVFRDLDKKELDKPGDDGGSTQAVFDAKSQKPVLADCSFISFPESASAVWSKDSTRLALNYRAGGRYATTSLFKWDGKKFVEVPSPEELLSALVTAAKLKEVKALGLKPDAYQRRISDGFNTCQWVDDDTIVAVADSISSVLVKDKDGEDSVDVCVKFRCTLKLDPKTGTWKIVKSEKLKDE
ncbi:MAG: hypothetical protein NTV93_18365 [Verrucomicrobia bacterium]|nr:hypothetical protein [Verrucomicrobiota bacterium]